MRRLTPFAVLVLGIAFAIVAAGVASLFIRSSWIMLPIVLGSTVGTTLLMIRQWIQGPQQGQITMRQRRKSRAEIALQCALGVIMSIGLVALTVMISATAKPLCSCTVPQNLIIWFLTAVGSGLFTLLLVASFIAVYMTVRQLTNREALEPRAR